MPPILDLAGAVAGCAEAAPVAAFDDLDATEAALQRLGATTPDYQPHGLVVMRDPGGHLFCVGSRRG